MAQRRIATRLYWSMPLVVVTALVAIAAAVSGADGSTAVIRHERFSAASGSASKEVSANWAGYVATAPSTSYTSVTASWTQPKVTCGTTDAGSASAFWVGLGGYASESESLEQVGTSSDCDSKTGTPTYYAWYELLPDPPTTIKSLKVAPGDRITTSVNILDGNTVLVQVKNRTRKTSFTKKLAMANPDSTSAEWIAEAPSACNGNRCSTVSLANFGSVQFTGIAALGNGIGGTLTANPGWTTTSISLVANTRRGFFPGPETFSRATTSGAGANPGDATTDGRSFTVTWSADGSATG